METGSPILEVEDEPSDTGGVITLPHHVPSTTCADQVLCDPESLKPKRTETNTITGESAFHVPRSGSPEEEFHFFSLTPAWLKGKLHVYKAVSRSRVPLWFGKPLPGVLRRFQRSTAIHPIP